METVCQFPKELNVYLLHDLSFFSLNVYPVKKKKKIICLYIDLYVNVHCSFIYNSQNLETTKCPSKVEWINKLSNIFDEIWLNIKKEWFFF